MANIITISLLKFFGFEFLKSFPKQDHYFQQTAFKVLLLLKLEATEEKNPTEV